MTKRIIALLGVILLLLGVFSLALLRQNRTLALEEDQLIIVDSVGGEEDNCQNIIREISVPDRVMTEKESQTLRVVLSNLDNPGTCHTTVGLAALDFDIAPAATARVVALEPGGNPVTLLWILKPRDIGAFEIAITAGNQTQILGIVVTNVLGFTAAQVQILSYLSSFLGPMLTAPWWYEQWEKRKKARKEETEKAAAKDAAEQSKPETAENHFQPE